jgi:hypothetical protein
MAADRLVNARRLGFGGKAMVLQYPIGLDRLMSEDWPNPGAPGTGEIQVVLQDANGGTEFRPSDQVVSCFFSDWQEGAAILCDFRRTPGDGIDGFAREHFMLPATAFTRAPIGCDAVEAATITIATSRHGGRRWWTPSSRPATWCYCSA